MTARGHSFRHSHHIKSVQVQRAFQHYIADGDMPLVDSSDASRSSLHEWDNYIWIDIGEWRMEAERVRLAKRNIANALVDLFDEWQESGNSFEQDVNEEVHGYGNALLQLYGQAIEALTRGQFIEYMGMTTESELLEMLMCYDSDKLDFKSRLNRVTKFLASRHFAEVPFVELSCTLTAILRKRVREGQFSNREKAKIKLAGLPYDIDAISIFGPYADAMFIDRSMHEWLKRDMRDLCKKYGMQIYSAQDWTSFNAFLDEVGNGGPPELDDLLATVYPRG